MIFVAIPARGAEPDVMGTSVEAETDHCRNQQRPDQAPVREIEKHLAS